MLGAILTNVATHRPCGLNLRVRDGKDGIAAGRLLPTLRSFRD
jgi:hypothetical protein